MNRKHESKADHTSWCNVNNKAGVNLAKILNEINNGQLTWRINVFMGRYIEKFTRLNLLHSRDMEYFSNLHYKQYVDVLKEKNIEDFVDEKMAIRIRTHISVAISTIYKEFLRKNNLR